MISAIFAYPKLLQRYEVQHKRLKELQTDHIKLEKMYNQLLSDFYELYLDKININKSNGTS